MLVNTLTNEPYCKVLPVVPPVHSLLFSNTGGICTCLTYKTSFI